MRKKRTALDWIVLVVVVVIAVVIIALSFQNTALLASLLSLNPYLAAGLVEVLFASLLFIRGRQRATQKNVPLFLEIGYFISLGFVTATNMYGLYRVNNVVGPIVGGAISGAMWLMESTLVWLWTDSDKPHQKSLREVKKEAKKEIKKMKILQRIEWMKWEAQKPDLSLIRKARKEEEKRKKVVGDGLPEFFSFEQTPKILEVIEQEPEVFKRKTETTEQEHEVFEQVEQEEPEMFEQTPKMLEVIEQEPEVFKRELEMIEQEESEVFERKPWMKPLIELIKEEVEQNRQLPTIRGLANKAKVTTYKAGEALKVWKGIAS